MDSSFISNGDVSGFKDKESMVDPFLVEALQNPRHRVTSQCSLPLSQFLISKLFFFFAVCDFLLLGWFVCYFYFSALVNG